MKILVAMSGGVDSSVAAALIARQGHEAVGVTLKLLPRAETGFGCCGSPSDVEDAKRVCETLGIPHYTADLSELFESRVIAPFVSSYLEGRTPNPCLECNRHLKFGHLLGLARAWGCRGVATGHYARAEGGRLLKSADEVKDQTYFLYRLTAKELAWAHFPVGGLTKMQVREQARALGLRTADKPESQEICFVPRRDYRGFIAARTPQAPALAAGTIEDSSGRPVGRHSGVASYTIGQRKGLALEKSSPEPMYVTAIKPETNTVVVGPSSETLSRSFEVNDVSWAGESLAGPADAHVRIRHRHAPAPARVTPLDGGRARVDFQEPQRAVTPGQAAVFYQDDAVLGGGTIQ